MKVEKWIDDTELIIIIIAKETKNVRQFEGRMRTTDNIVYELVDDYSTLEKHWKFREKWYIKRGATIITKTKK